MVASGAVTLCVIPIRRVYPAGATDWDRWAPIPAHEPPWDVLLADYNILRGRLWVLVLATVLLGPILVGTILGCGEAPAPSSDSGSPSTSEPCR
jgi:hypothetical protein